MSCRVEAPRFDAKGRNKQPSFPAFSVPEELNGGGPNEPPADSHKGKPVPDPNSRVKSGRGPDRQVESGAESGETHDRVGMGLRKLLPDCWSVDGLFPKSAPG